MSGSTMDTLVDDLVGKALVHGFSNASARHTVSLLVAEFKHIYVQKKAGMVAATPSTIAKSARYACYVALNDRIHNTVSGDREDKIWPVGIRELVASCCGGFDGGVEKKGVRMSDTEFFVKIGIGRIVAP